MRVERLAVSVARDGPVRPVPFPIRHAGEGVHAVRTRLVVKTDPGRTDPPFVHHQMQGVAAQGAFRLLTLDVVDDFARTDDVTLLVVVMVAHG